MNDVKMWTSDEPEPPKPKAKRICEICRVEAARHNHMCYDCYRDAYHNAYPPESRRQFEREERRYREAKEAEEDEL